MATATRVTKRYTPPPDRIILDLSEGEAKHILSVIGRVAHKWFSESQVEDTVVNRRIYEALTGAGVSVPFAPTIPFTHN